MDKYQYSERDICTKFITPAIVQAGWLQHQFREEVPLTDGCVMARGKLAARVANLNVKGGPKRADFVLYARSNVPIAIVEAKQARLSVGHGMQHCDQARVVLEALLDKFADHGVQNIEDAKVLELPPFDQFGNNTQICRSIFGSVEQFTQAVQALEQALYEENEKKQA